MVNCNAETMKCIALDQQSRESATGMAQYRGIGCIRIDFDGFYMHHLLHTPVESSRGSFLQKLAKLVFGQPCVLNDFLEQWSFDIAGVHQHGGDDLARMRARVVAMA